MPENPVTESKTPIEVAQEMLHFYLEEEKRILKSAQDYSIAGQALRRAQLSEVRKGRQEWEDKLNSLMGLTKRVLRKVVPVND